jgi:hypothetical protein
MASKRNPPGEPMTLGNMRSLGVRRLAAFCHNNACRHQALIDVETYPDHVEGSLVPHARPLRQVRRPGHRRAAELEGKADGATPLRYD